MHRLIPLTLLLLATMPVCGHAETVSLGMNDYSAQIVFAKTVDQGPADSMTASIRGLYNKSEDTILGSFDLMALGTYPIFPGLKFGAGVTLYGGEAAKDSFLVLGLGGKIRYAPVILGGLGFGAQLRYAPGILSTLDANRLVETDYSIEYQIIPRALVFIRYHNIRMDFTNGIERSPEEGIRAGFILSY